MIEFGVKRASKGKRSRWSKKFPRKKILHRRDEKYYNWFKNNWNDDKYSYFSGDLYKFLRANVGRPVDKVFSEFLQRCDRTAKVYNLRKWFFDYFEEKSNIGYTGGFYITNGIINYKKRTKRPKYVCFSPTEDYNRNKLPDFPSICKRCEETHTKHYFGEFELHIRGLSRVYLVERAVYEDNLKMQSHYELCSIYGVGKGIEKHDFPSQDKLYRFYYELCPRYSVHNPEFVFITKVI